MKHGASRTIRFGVYAQSFKTPCIERILPSVRRDETEFWADFQIAKPAILGEIFSTLSKAMEIYPTVNLKKLARMADFVKWGYSIGEALEVGGGNMFLKAYEVNINSQNEEIIQNNTLILAIMKEMNEKTKLEGTIKSIYRQLFDATQLDKNDPTFPKSNRTLRKHLERIKTSLVQQGINFSIGRRTSDGIPLTITREQFQEEQNLSTFDSSTTLIVISGSNKISEANLQTDWKEPEIESVKNDDTDYSVNTEKNYTLEGDNLKLLESLLSQV